MDPFPAGKISGPRLSVIQFEWRMKYNKAEAAEYVGRQFL
jgi:hypothetical protein